jgi:GNAT superfamily N-acetyltransferase
MVATSDIPRSPSYLISLLDQGQTSVAREIQTGKAVAWVVSHADSSLGTLYTLEDHRQKGLARAVVTHRVAEARGRTRGFAYVSEGNEPSEAVWKGLGWTVGWRAWWIVTG